MVRVEVTDGRGVNAPAKAMALIATIKSEKTQGSFILQIVELSMVYG